MVYLKFLRRTSLVYEINIDVLVASNSVVAIGNTLDIVLVGRCSFTNFLTFSYSCCYVEWICLSTSTLWITTGFWLNISAFAIDRYNVCLVLGGFWSVASVVYDFSANQHYIVYCYI